MEDRVSSLEARGSRLKGLSTYFWAVLYLVNEICQPSKRSHRACVLANSILGIPAQKLKQENTFKSEGSTWYWTVRNLHYHCIIETYKSFWVPRFQVSWFKSLMAPLFSKLKILDIYQINTFQIAKSMCRYHNNLSPPLFFNLFFYEHSWL